MKILVTGAGGYIGNNLAHALAANGFIVHALVRSAKADESLRHPNITIFRGDITDPQKLSPAIKGCAQVYHTAARVGLWAKDPLEFYKTNVEGTRNILDLMAREKKIRGVFTGSCGVIGPSLQQPMREEDPRMRKIKLHYDRSKKMAEDLVFEYAKKGGNAVVVSPAKVYGPGNISHSLTANALIKTFLEKHFALVPAPGNYKVSCAYIHDIVNGHILAMEKGRSGEKYILGGNNLSYFDFFDRIRTLSSGKGKIFSLPKALIILYAHLQQLRYKVTGIPPALPVKAVDELLCSFSFSSEKAIRELGYKITALDEALNKTIYFLKNSA